MTTQADFVAAAVRRNNGSPVRLELDASTAIALVGQVQLALRHPYNTESSAILIEGFVRGLIDVLAVGPDAATLRAGLMRGFDPDYDQEPKGRAERAAWFRRWYRTMPETWRAGLWRAVDGGAFLGELPAAAAAANLGGVGVFFLPLPLARVLAEALERGDFPGSAEAQPASGGPAP